MEPAARLVLELPDLHVPDRGRDTAGQHLGVAAVDDVGPRLVVDHELVRDVVVVELEHAGPLGLVDGDAHDLVDRQPRRHGVAVEVGRGSGDDTELHDLVRVVVVLVVEVAAVEHLDLRARRVLREVDEQLVPLGAGVPVLADAGRSRHQAAIGPDDRELRVVRQVQPQRPGDRRVEDAEPVDPSGDLHVGPRLAVDEDDVAPQAREVVVLVGQLAVRGEHRVVDGQADVVRTLGQVALLDAVVQVVLRGQSAVGVLRRVVHAVVVVPERPGVLEVGVPVVLVVPGLRDVVRVAVVLRQGRRAVQVGRRAEAVAPLRVGRGEPVDDPHLDRQAAVGGVRPVDVDDRAGDAHRALHAVVVDVGVPVHRGLEARQDVRLGLLLDHREEAVLAPGAVLQRALQDAATQLRTRRELGGERLGGVGGRQGADRPGRGGAAERQHQAAADDERAAQEELAAAEAHRAPPVVVVTAGRWPRVVGRSRPANRGAPAVRGAAWRPALRGVVPIVSL